MILRRLILSLLATAAPLCAFAEPVLRFPEGTSRAYENLDLTGSLQIPVGPFIDGNIDMMPVSGAVMRQVWKTPGRPADTFSLFSPLRDQLVENGYAILYECETRDCGGFDFRFNADVVDEPDMHVDIGDFHYLAATIIVDGEQKYLSLLISKSPERGFVQVTTIGAPDDRAVDFALSTKQTAPTGGSTLAEGLTDLLLQDGAAVLEGLEFLKGSADLSGSPAAALQELAVFLELNPRQTVVLVGHTDASGSLEGNVALSRKRAESVMARLVDTYGVEPARLSAEGIGYLAPRASNATEEGRERNRRVEVVLTFAE